MIRVRVGGECHSSVFRILETHVDSPLKVPEDSLDSFQVLLGRLRLISSTHTYSKEKIRPTSSEVH